MAKDKKPKPSKPKGKVGRPKGKKTKAGPQFPTRVFRMPSKEHGALRPLQSKKGRGKWAPKFGVSTKLCDELVKDLCSLIRAGNYANTACAVLGISASAFHSWLKKGNEVLRTRNPDQLVPGDYEYANFVCQLRLAHAEAEALDVDRLNAHIEAGDSKALLKKMAIRYGKRWREVKEKEIEHRHSGSIAHTHAVLTLEDLRLLPLDIRKKMLETIRNKGVTDAGTADYGDKDLRQLPAVQQETELADEGQQADSAADGSSQGSGRPRRKVGLRELPSEESNGDAVPS